MPPVRTSRPPSFSAPANACELATVWLLALAEDVALGDPEADRLGRDHVLERAALLPGEDGLVDRLAVFLLAEDEPGARSAERLVRRRRDDVRVRDRARVLAGRDEPGEVRHVDHQLRADLVGDPLNSAKSSWRG